MKRIPIAIRRDQVPRMLRIRLNLFTQPRDRAIDGPHGARRNRAPNLLNQLVPMNRTFGPLGEELQDLEFPIRERDGSRGTDRAVSDEVDRDPAETDEIDHAARS